MNDRFWGCLGLIALVVLELFLLLQLSFMGMAENCDQLGGNSSLGCNDTVRAVLIFAVIALPLVIAVVVLRRPDRRGFECCECGRRLRTEEEAIEHAESAHGLLSYPEMEASWRRVELGS